MKPLKLVYVFMFLFLLSTYAVFARNSFLPKTFTAKFEQTHKSKIRGKIKRNTGIIEYQFPGKIRFEINKPNKIIFVSNPQKTWYYTAPYIEGMPGELTAKNTGKSGPARFFDILVHGLKDNKFYSMKKIKSGYKLTFKKKTAKETGIKDATLLFKNSSHNKFTELKFIEVLYVEGKKVTTNFQEIKESVKFKTNRFKFTPPPKTNNI